MKGVTASSHVQIPMQGYKDHEESKKHDTNKGKNKVPVSNPKEMEIYELPERGKKKKIILSSVSHKRTLIDN